MYNENSNCVPTYDPTYDCAKESRKAPLSELLTKLNDLSESNLSLANGIKNSLYGIAPANGDSSMPVTCCMEDSIRNAMRLALDTNEILVGIREGL